MLGGGVSDRGAPEWPGVSHVVRGKANSHSAVAGSQCGAPAPCRTRRRQGGPGAADRKGDLFFILTPPSTVTTLTG